MAASKRRALKRAAKALQIADLFHFTQIESLDSILTYGLVQRNNPGDATLLMTDPYRLDGRPDCICLSASFPNYSMFWAIRRDRYPEREWCVLRLRSRIVWNFSCLFFPQNAARWGPNTVRAAFRTKQAFETMFAGNRLANLPPHHPTDVQAEIQVEQSIRVDEITAIYFESQYAMDNWLRKNTNVPSHITVAVRPELFWNRDKFLAQGNT